MAERKKMNGKKGFYDLLRGKKVVVQARSGTIYEGILAGKDEGYLILSEVKIIGAKRVAYVDFVGIDRGVVAHIHPEPKRIEGKQF